MSGGYSLTYRDFSSLIRDEWYRERMARLLREWGYRLVGFGAATRIVDGDGRDVDALGLHEATQADPDRQLSLYQTAMDLWR